MLIFIHNLGLKRLACIIYALLLICSIVLFSYACSCNLSKEILMSNRYPIPLRLFIPILTILALRGSVSNVYAHETLVLNGDFSEWSENGPADWTVEQTGLGDNIPVSVDEAGHNGPCVMLESAEPDTICLVQTVPASPDTVYHFSAYVKTEDLKSAGSGAALSSAMAQCYPLSGNDADGKWEYIEFYGMTQPDQTNIEVRLSLGDMWDPASGKVWFDDVEVVQTDDLPEGANVVFLEPDPENEDPTFFTSTRHTAAFLLLAVLLILSLIAIVRKSGRAAGSPEDDRRRDYLLLAVPAVFFLLYLYSVYFCQVNGKSLTAPNIIELLKVYRSVMHAGWAVVIPVVFLAAALFLRKKHPDGLCLIGSVLWLVLILIGPLAPAYYMLFPLWLLLVSYLRLRDWRILAVWISLTAASFLHLMIFFDGGVYPPEALAFASLEDVLCSVLTIVIALTVPVLLFLTVDICGFHHLHVISRQDPEQPQEGEKGVFEAADYRLHLSLRGFVPVALITAVYAVIAFVNLGSMTGPQTSWSFEEAGESLVFDLGKTETFRFTWLNGISDTDFMVELSDDGKEWTVPAHAACGMPTVFQWQWFIPLDFEQQPLREDSPEISDAGTCPVLSSEQERFPFQTARYVRLTAPDGNVTLFEAGFLDTEGSLLPVQSILHEGGAGSEEGSWMRLIDEQDMVPDHPSYLNSFYFDEIYHARTAYENLHGLHSYEWTHPPLGKVIMMIGIKIFGMTGFGWRFTGTLFGVLMLPVLFLLVMQLTGNYTLSLIAMCLFSVDSMHFTQTRIATVDSYAVFFILLMYLFMLRYCQMNWNRDPFRKTLLPLGLCGITMGLGWAVKWICIYASAGLAVLFFWSLFRRLKEDARLGRLKEGRKKAGITICFCIIFFIVIPVIIYYFSYYWLLRGEGLNSFGEMFSTHWVEYVIQLQQQMMNYHSSLFDDGHFFSSPWYQWPVIWWPIWFYDGSPYLAEGMVSSISCMGNPAVWWFGLAAVIFITVKVSWSRKASERYVFVLIGFASQYLPWLLVPRSTFIYHYFASVPFIIIASILVLDTIRDRSVRAYRITAGLLVISAVVLFAMFYPLESGLPVPLSYARHLRWFHWINY